jgi:hypothetical protein
MVGTLDREDGPEGRNLEAVDRSHKPSFIGNRPEGNGYWRSATIKLGIDHGFQVPALERERRIHKALWAVPTAGSLSLSFTLGLTDLSFLHCGR